MTPSNSSIRERFGRRYSRHASLSTVSDAAAHQYGQDPSGFGLARLRKDELGRASRQLPGPRRRPALPLKIGQQVDGCEEHSVIEVMYLPSDADPLQHHHGQPTAEMLPELVAAGEHEPPPLRL